MKRLSIVMLLVALLPNAGRAIRDSATLDINRWRMPVTDWGVFGNRGAWRQPSQNYLWACGIWIGAIQGAETLTSLAFDPNGNACEYQPGDSLGGEADPLVRVYVTPSRWPAPSTRFPRAPQTYEASQEAWTCFNDFNESLHVRPGRPLGAQVYLSGYAWQYRIAEDMIFLKFVVENQSAGPWQHAYFGTAVDYDIGDGTDDMFSAFRRRWIRGEGNESVYVNNLAMGWDADGLEPGWDSVGALGVEFIRTPSERGAVTIRRLTPDNSPQNDAGQYLTLAGYDWRTGIYDPIDTTDVSPTDKRIVMATGPFDLQPGAAESVVVVFLATTRQPAPYHLAQLCVTADSLYPQGVAETWEPGAAAAPALHAEPNPFRDRVVLHASHCTHNAVLRFHDVSGRLVRDLHLSEPPRLRLAESTSITWDGRDNSGRLVPAGCYIVTLTDGRQSMQSRLVLSR